MVEYARVPGDSLWDAFFARRLPLVDGAVTPSDAPGFGIELDEEALAATRVG
jgi:L-alanine-DL-glutamate epimerase-like enolase superfamily enzyme